MVSYDNDRDAYVLRQFNSEGFVNAFVLDDASTPPECCRSRKTAVYDQLVILQSSFRLAARQ